MKSASPTNKKQRTASSKDLEAFGDISDDVIESDFVPYACLFDLNTLATKDAELIQIIKITGLGYDAASHSSLREHLRKAIRDCIPDDRYAIWLHTLRRKHSAQTRNHYPDAFSGKLDEAWRITQPASVFYNNELYVSLVRASEPVSLTNKEVLMRSIRAARDIAHREEAMRESLVALNRVTAAMLAQLKPFGARLLTTVEREGVMYGEHLEFLEKLINLEERPMPLPDRDLSQVLTSGEITFAYNAMEVRTAENVRRFAAILTLKEYKESTLPGIDQFLDIPCEVIISQCFDFTGAEQAREAYEKQARYLQYSGDKEFAKWIEIDRLMDTGISRFGLQQTSIFLIAPSVTQLESNLRMVQRALNRLGMVVIREDLRFEECYWAQLPGNSNFVVRNHPVDTEHLAGFVNLQAAPMGNAAGSPWGAPLSIFTTVQDRPYYFNFHRAQTAHTMVLGKSGSGRTSLTHFLLAQARKLPVNIWYLDVHGRGRTFLESMGGGMVTPGSVGCKLNPFMMEKTPANREFLALWLSTLIDPTGAQLNRATLTYFQSVIDQISRLPREQQRMATVINLVREADGALAKALTPFAAGGIYGELFDMPEDTFKTGRLIGWDISRWMQHPATRIPLTGYLLHRITGALNGTPTLVVLDEGFDILDTPLFSMRAGGWLDHLTQHNAAAMISLSHVDRASTRSYAPQLASKMATIFALPDRNPGEGYMMGFGFTPEDMATVGAIRSEAHHILQKRGSESIVISLSLSSLPRDTLSILSGSQANLSPADTLAQLMSTKQTA